MLDAGALIEKHRSKGVLVDTNLLVLLLVGLVNRRRVPEFKRTQDFTIDDFDTLSRLMDWFGKLITTPHVLSQVSDLAAVQGKELAKIRKRFGLLVDAMDEHYEPSRSLVADPLFARLGLADVAIGQVCSKGILVLTSDLDLHLALSAPRSRRVKFQPHPCARLAVGPGSTVSDSPTTPKPPTRPPPAFRAARNARRRGSRGVLPGRGRIRARPESRPGQHERAHPSRHTKRSPGR